MKLIIAGSRGLNPSHAQIESALKEFNLSPTEIVCGWARGADTAGANWAKANNIPVKDFPAEWDKYGKSAGYIRNTEMMKYADAALLFYDGKSSGTFNMRMQMHRANKPCYMVY